jgi:two-component system nitrogen regulation sensor histidine kinase GlnL
LLKVTAPMPTLAPHPEAEAAAADRGFDAFDRLATMVALVAADGQCLRVNTALENITGVSRRLLCRGSVLDWFTDSAPLRDTLRAVVRNDVTVGRFDALMKRAPGALGAGHGELPVHAIVGPLDGPGRVLLELIEVEQQARLTREEQVATLAQANKELVRNLAHEIKNPLGGIRGAAQLLAMEVESQDLTAYTQVIVQEADRLQSLVDRLLLPHRHAQVLGAVNIHEVCERVRSLILAEFPRGLLVDRDYDASLPEFRGDREQLIQAVLNVAHNAAQALAPRIAEGSGRIVLRTRVARQVTLVKQRFRLALELHVEDNGPGVPERIRDRIFHPLVSGREGGSGLGLTLAQTFVQQHGGTIECDSVPGRTVFKLLFPLPT